MVKPADASKKVADIVYDIFTVSLALLDVISDVAIAIQWWKDGRTAYFGIAVAIFCIATLCYTTLFCGIYVEGDDKKGLKVFLLMLPLGQLIPVIIWVQSFRFGPVDAVFEFFGLNIDGIEEPTVEPGDDPLRVYLEHKLLTHGGFMIESVVEAAPQSILQMVAIVVLEEWTPLNVISIAISIVSVASKGLMVSYSIDRPTFIFNFSCICLDVVGVFTTVSWLFFVAPSQKTGSVFFLSGPVSLLSAIWFYKEFCIVCVVVLWGIGLIVVITISAIREHLKGGGPRRGDVVLFPIVVFFCIILLFPALTVLEGFKFTAIPLFLNDSMDSPYSYSPAFFRGWFDWVLRDGDFIGKIYITNRYIAEQSYTDTQLTRYLRTVSRKDFSLAMVRHLRGYSIAATRAELKAINWSCQNFSLPNKRKEQAQVLLAAYFICVVVPLLASSAVYAVVYPILSFSMTKYSEISLLQLVLSYMTFGVLFIIVILSVRVYRFKRAEWYLELCSMEALALPWQEVLGRITSKYDIEKEWWKEGNYEFTQGGLYAGTVQTIEGVPAPLQRPDEVPMPTMMYDESDEYSDGAGIDGNPEVAPVTALPQTPNCGDGTSDDGQAAPAARKYPPAIIIEDEEEELRDNHTSLESGLSPNSPAAFVKFLVQDETPTTMELLQHVTPVLPSVRTVNVLAPLEKMSYGARALLLSDTHGRRGTQHVRFRGHPYGDGKEGLEGSQEWHRQEAWKNGAPTTV